MTARRDVTDVTGNVTGGNSRKLLIPGPCDACDGCDSPRARTRGIACTGDPLIHTHALARVRAHPVTSVTSVTKGKKQRVMGDSGCHIGCHIRHKSARVGVRRGFSA